MTDDKTPEELLKDAESKATAKTVKIDQIRENPVALRECNPQDEQYKQLVESIREKGFIGTITTREKKDPETGDVFYEIVDGLQRYTAAKEAGISELVTLVLNMTDYQVYEAQVMLNLHRVDTKPTAYTDALKRMFMANTLLTEAEVARSLGVDITWVKNRLGLSNVKSEKIQKLIDDGEIRLSNAFALAKLPEEAQEEMLEAAIVDDSAAFAKKVAERAKAIREARRQGRLEEEVKFEPREFLQKMGDIKAERDSGEIAADLISASGVSTLTEAFKLALNWVLHVDVRSIEAQKAKFDAELAKRQAKREETARKKQERAAERAAAKADKLAAEAAVAAEAAKAALEQKV